MNAIESQPKYPNITVRLTGTDGNAYAILGTVQRALRKNGVSQQEISQFMDEAMGGDYDHLLQTCVRWVRVS